MHADDLPAWLTPTTLADWPTRRVGSEELRYVVGLPVAWNPDPHERLSLHEYEHVFAGPLPCDRLAVAFLPDADPGANLRLWVEAIIAVTGFPLPAPTPDAGAAPELLEWQPLATPASLPARLAVDEVALYQGLGRLPGPPALLARLYVLLARRAQRAWKVVLAFESACPPGTPAAAVQANDHVRGGAVFGDLEFLDDGA